MSPTDPNRGLKVLTRVLLERAGSLDAAEVCVRVRKSSLSNYANVHQPETFAPIDVIARLGEIAGEPLVTAELARRAHHTLIPVEPVAEGKLAALLARVGAESGHVFTAFGEALSNDGQVDAAERAGIARELHDLIRAAHAALGHLQGRPTPVGGSGGQRLRLGGREGRDAAELPCVQGHPPPRGHGHVEGGPGEAGRLLRRRGCQPTPGMGAWRRKFNPAMDRYPIK